jgi:4-amino-4-deoxy-L-arabinose transferase-like glycosyltransferase
LTIFALAYVTLQLTRATHLSATWDEPIHLTAGYAAVAERDFRVDPTHPPFMRAWAALPLLVLPHATLDTTAIDQARPRDWLTGGYAFARDFLYGTPDADRLLLAARAMVVLWGVVLGLLVFAWAYEWLGLPGAALALVLYALEPNLGAHAALVTTDFGITVFVFGAAYFLWRVSQRVTRRDVALLAACVALAAVTKFSAVLLIPILLVLLVAAVARGPLTTRQAGTIAAVATAATIVTIWAAYGFRYQPSRSDGWLLTSAAFDGAGSMPWLRSAADWIDHRHLLPNAYTQGLLIALTSVGVLPAFLAGEVKTGGWWYYFPLAFTLKTALTILALGVVGLVTLARRRDRVLPLTPLFVLAPGIIWLAVAMTSGVNLGVRHVLPIYPFVILTAAAGGQALLERRGAARVIVVAAVVLLAVEVGRSGAYPLSFFNALAGGPANGSKYLADSNLTWGGNLKALKAWMDDNGVAEINLAYFGSVDPAYYGIRATYLPSSATFLQDRVTRPTLPGYVAISGTVLDGVYLPGWWRLFYAGFHDRDAAAIVAKTTRIYWVDKWPEAAAATGDAESLEVLAEGLLFGLRWPERAIVRYRQYLDRQPADPRAWNGLSLALSQVGRLNEALTGFRRVQALAPADRDVQRNIAVLERQVADSSR